MSYSEFFGDNGPLTIILLNQLCAFIREHNFRCYPENGKIRAEMLYSSSDGSFTQWETIEPTLSAVRDWLGY